MSCQDLCKRPLGKISPDLHAMSLCMASIRGVLARSLYKIFTRGLVARSLGKGPLGKISTDLCARSLYETSAQGSLEEFSWQDLCKRPLGATDLCAMSVQDLHMWYPGKISVQDLYFKNLWARSLLFSPGLCTRSLSEIFWQDRCTRTL